MIWSETTLNCWMVVERYPILKEEVGSLIPGYEISSLLDKKLAKWSTASRALALACLNNKKNITMVFKPTNYFLWSGRSVAAAEREDRG